MAATTEYTYDVFISYSQADQDWVHDQLLPEFDKAGVRYIDQLEFVLGRPKLIEIALIIPQRMRAQITLVFEVLEEF